MTLYKNLELFRQESFADMLFIPPHKPDLFQIMDIIVSPEILDYSIVETPKGLSYEGQYMSGYKLLVDVALNEKLTYISSTEEQTIHAVQYTQFKSICIMLPESVNQKDTAPIIQSGLFSLHPSIEGIHTKILDSRTVQKCGLLLVHLNFS